MWVKNRQIPAKNIVHILEQICLFCKSGARAEGHFAANKRVPPLYVPLLSLLG